MKRSVEIRGEWFPVEKILGRSPSTAELQGIMAAEEELSDGTPLVIKAPKKAHDLIGRNRLFVSRRGSELCMRRPDGHTWYTEQVASDRKAARDRAHFVPAWSRKSPDVITYELDELDENKDEGASYLSDATAYTKLLEAAGELEPVVDLIGVDARKKCGARVLSLSEVNPRLLDIAEPI